MYAVIVMARTFQNPPHAI